VPGTGALAKHGLTATKPRFIGGKPRFIGGKPRFIGTTHLTTDYTFYNDSLSIHLEYL
jgi:hypothetical protein